VIRKRRDGLQVQVYAGRDPLTGRKRYVSQQVAGQTKASMRQAKQIEAQLLAEIGTGQHKGARSRTMADLLERWLEWRPTVRPIAPTTVSSYRAAMDRYILPALGKLPVRRVDAATLDAFYAQLRTRGGKDGRPLTASAVHEVHAVSPAPSSRRWSGAGSAATQPSWQPPRRSRRRTCSRRRPRPLPGSCRPRWRRIRSWACSSAWPSCSAPATASCLRWAAGRRRWAQRQLRPRPGRPVPGPTAGSRPGQRPRLGAD
jgi:hypothetical protein